MTMDDKTFLNPEKATEAFLRDLRRENRRHIPYAAR